MTTRASYRDARCSPRSSSNDTSPSYTRCLCSEYLRCTTTSPPSRRASIGCHCKSCLPRTSVRGGPEITQQRGQNQPGPEPISRFLPINGARINCPDQITSRRTSSSTVSVARGRRDDLVVAHRKGEGQ